MLLTHFYHLFQFVEILSYFSIYFILVAEPSHASRWPFCGGSYWPVTRAPSLWSFWASESPGSPLAPFLYQRSQKRSLSVVGQRFHSCFPGKSCQTMRCPVRAGQTDGRMCWLIHRLCNHYCTGNDSYNCSDDPKWQRFFVSVPNCVLSFLEGWLHYPILIGS